MNFRRFLFVMLFLAVVVSCDDNDPVKPENRAPVLSNLVIPDTMFTQINASYVLSVQVTDEDGLEDIDLVSYEIVNQQGNLETSGDLFDDGDYNTHGDNIARDGKFAQRLSLDLPDGRFSVKVTATDFAELESAELTKDFELLAGKVNNAPTVTPVLIPDSVVVDVIQPFKIQVSAQDPDDGDAVSRVTYQLLGPAITDVAEQGELFDNGQSGDDIAGDGIYSIETTTAFASWKFGFYHLYVLAFDNQNKASQSYFKILPWKKSAIGVAPVLSQLSAPDTVKLPTEGLNFYLMTIYASDEDNNGDVKEVLFNSFKPDGTGATNNPFNLYDDGNTSVSGDQVAGDNIYSIVFIIDTSNQTGDYRFEFEAKDQSNLNSNKIVHIMTVIE